MSELQAIASTLSHDIIAVNETWLDLNGRHLPAEVSIKGYVLHNVDKLSHSNRGGGSLIYIKEKLQPQIITKGATQKSEILHLNIQPHPGQTIKIVLVYRNPTCTVIEDDEFYDCIDNILSTPHETLIMGDFNLPHINWTPRQSRAPGSKLIHMMNTNSLQQHVNEPTRGNNSLHLVMTTTDLSINGLEVTGKIGDHQMIDFSLDVQDPNTRSQYKQVLDYKRANFKLMKEELGNHNYEVLMSNKNPEECYMVLKDEITTATEHHIPRKRIMPANNPPWFSQEIKRLINVKQHSRLKRDTIGPLIDSEGSTQTNNKSKVKILNTYFTSVFTHEDLTEIPQPHALNRQEILSDGVFTVEEVQELLNILNPDKSTGVDGLGPRKIKETAEVISEPLTNIFNRSLETGIVPDDWKRANVTPIFKKRNKQIPTNYRPISLTSVISKTIEKLLKVRITKHLSDQNLINDIQHGFREKRSCLTNLLDFFGEVNRIYDRTKSVDLVYLDFQKAFDKVLHERLMAKVEAYRIRGNYFRWIRNWLTSRT
ncbi:Endonuclease/exonuclease/phosphatase [Trinorchestia longiramus]|nr:Endonuclease/exonuclease/phosphatase [Trinorchestia longiramus]